jgi:hypothetical protein
VTTRLFAVEHYDDTGGHVAPLDPFPALPAHVHLTGAVYLPSDEVVIAFVEGPDEASVGEAITAAGWRVDRISPADWLAGGRGWQ